MPFRDLYLACAPQLYSDARQPGLAIVASKLIASTHLLLTSLLSHLLRFHLQIL